MATHEFDGNRKVSSVLMTSVDAFKGAENASECADFFKTIVAKLATRFGEADFKPAYHKENGYISSLAIFTFEDSSSIHAEYKYPDNQIGTEKCVIKIYPKSPWASSSFDEAPNSAPLMRTPWSRYK